MPDKLIESGEELEATTAVLESIVEVSVKDVGCAEADVVIEGESSLSLLLTFHPHSLSESLQSVISSSDGAADITGDPWVFVVYFTLYAGVTMLAK